MIPSLTSNGMLPESYEDWQELRSRTFPQFKLCINCGSEFSPENTHSPEGWRETQISGFCEDCFEGLFEEE